LQFCIARSIELITFHKVSGKLNASRWERWWTFKEWRTILDHKFEVSGEKLAIEAFTEKRTFEFCRDGKSI